MLDRAEYAATDPNVVRALISPNPWAIMVSNTDGGLVASHCPVLLDDTRDDLVVLTHVAKPDGELHRLGTSEILLIVSGDNGYISPSWYAADETLVPTWNFSVAHCYGVPEILSDSENLKVLTRLVDHFEKNVEQPTSLDRQLGARLVAYTIGMRLPITRFICKVKMSQDKDPLTQARILNALSGDGPYRNASLAEAMHCVLAPRDQGARPETRLGAAGLRWS